MHILITQRYKQNNTQYWLENIMNMFLSKLKVHHYLLQMTDPKYQVEMHINYLLLMGILVQIVH